jgi:hypothetical protein
MEPKAWHNRCMAENRNRTPARRRQPWFALTLGGGLPAALAAAAAPWPVIAAIGLFDSVALWALYVFMEGASPAREWAETKEAWRPSSDRRKGP